MVSTPLRLVDALQSEGAVSLKHVRRIVFDEADKLFELGFLEQTDSILSACTNKHRRTALFSATLPSGVEQMAESIMLHPLRVTIGKKDSANQAVHQSLKFVTSEEGKLVEIRQMIRAGALKLPCLIFLQSVDRAKALHNELLYDGVKVGVIHGERSQADRDAVLDMFKQGKVWVLICTDLIARGIDFKGVQMVINYDVPQSAQAYIHRIGRTGRAGQTGEAVTFYTKEDVLGLKMIVNVMKQSGNPIDDWMETLGGLTKREKQTMKKKNVTRAEISTLPFSRVPRPKGVSKRHPRKQTHESTR
ncbi:hypothetical protein CANCADRAFT_32953 [Tortispora caseinolytica NRRL Y-17796]|uniref:RNA helicase n=1 Tax=Tortispora caseinolytica NRRL Y-17796 TaxID=767744 RepID=A0A1E4TDH7_9ASCO|nr:hypothetical protein CANCADRAFT_32953 [Tortispora caseinolytica NRRL Y-17796]